MKKLPYGKTHVAIASTHRFNCPAAMGIETLEATSVFYNLLLLKLIFSHKKKYRLVAEIIDYNSI
ncbi:Uncharacterized protein APZ42_003363 [Daphnia magna]|uniref:Uncharacterized protein n=1 Tax=Daphnia magna TaxID=35525 RepID=A0A164HKZ3_9CRUS|nr:Uncharacterized protein APZ42_003363 [Daphnia magna]